MIESNEAGGDKMGSLDKKIIKFAKGIKRDFYLFDFLKGSYLKWDDLIKEKVIDSLRRLVRKHSLARLNLTGYCRCDECKDYLPDVKWCDSGTFSLSWRRKEGQLKITKYCYNQTNLAPDIK